MTPRTYHLADLQFSTHALDEMDEENITVGEALQVVNGHDVIETRPQDKRGPFALIYGKINGRVIHVARVEKTSGRLGILTVYLANTVIFEDDLRTRRKKS